MAYTVNNFKSGDTLYASQLNKMDAQIIQNEVEMKALKSQIDNIVIEGGGLTLNRVYPVGSIYMSINSTDPTMLFGGTWERIKDTFLLSAGDTYEAGATGGEAEHTLTEDEMPKHSHNLMLYVNNTGSSTVPANYSALNTNTFTWLSSGASGKNSGLFGKANSTGGDQPHNNMPPYLTVYMWKRIA